MMILPVLPSMEIFTKSKPSGGVSVSSLRTIYFGKKFIEARLSLGFGSGIPIMFLLMNMLGTIACPLKEINVII